MQLESIGLSGLIEVPLTRQILIQFRTRALRKRVWYRTLSRIERGLVDLTIRWVDRIRSTEMTRIVKMILQKLTGALEMRMVGVLARGRILASRISDLATQWGNRSAPTWKFERGFQIALGLRIVAE